jgi:DNA invertase Pin-like site-specific DNA recombinase
MDGYIRVSRTAGRGGETFISPKVQRETIERLAKAKGAKLGEIVEEPDVSGARRIEDRKLGELVARVERGESAGVIVWKLSRFSRSLFDCVEATKRIVAAGGRLIADDFDSANKSMLNTHLGLLAGLAEDEREARGEGWRQAQRRAVERGVHIASRTPTGYRRREDKRLEPNPVAAPVIRELFLRRARGEGWTALARQLDKAGIHGPYGNGGWTGAAAAKIIKNRVYLGEARCGQYRNPSAHAPLVSPAEWEAAQGDRHVSSPRKGDGLLLSGLVRCAGCRYLLKPDSMRGRNGERIGMYRCRGRHAAGRCPAPATILARVLDPYVEEHFLAAIGPDGPLAEAVEASVAVEKALQEVEDAERELDAFLSDVQLRAMIGEERYRRQAEARTDALAAAEAGLADARQRGALSGDLLTSGALVEAWPGLTIAEKRVLFTASLDAVFIRRTGANVPVKDRALVLWRGEAPDGLPRRGHRFPLASFAWPEAPADVRVPVAEYA